MHSLCFFHVHHRLPESGPTSIQIFKSNFLLLRTTFGLLTPSKSQSTSKFPSFLGGEPSDTLADSNLQRLSIDVIPPHLRFNISGNLNPPIDLVASPFKDHMFSTFLFKVTSQNASLRNFNAEHFRSISGCWTMWRSKKCFKVQTHQDSWSSFVPFDLPSDDLQQPGDGPLATSAVTCQGMKEPATGRRGVQTQRPGWGDGMGGDGMGGLGENLGGLESFFVDSLFLVMFCCLLKERHVL